MSAATTQVAAHCDRGPVTKIEVRDAQVFLRFPPYDNRLPPRPPYYIIALDPIGYERTETDVDKILRA